MKPANGDTVRLVHSPGSVGVVSSVADDGVMVCLPIAHRYQLRGPFALDEVEVITGATNAS